MKIKLPAIIDNPLAGGKFFSPFWFVPSFLFKKTTFEIKGKMLILKTPLNSSTEANTFNLENMSKLLLTFKRFDYPYTKNYGLNINYSKAESYIELHILSMTGEKHNLLPEIIYNSKCKKVLKKLLGWLKSNTKLLIEENHLKVKEQV